MDSNILKVLNKIEENGFEAYIVGGYVRDLSMGIKTTDIDITTNALPKDLFKIFKKGTQSKDKYGSFRIIKPPYLFDITTYRKESSYVNRRPTEVIYINNLLEDLQRRDFTINSIIMNKNGEIIDLLDGLTDIKNKTIRVIGSPKIKLKEDPLRILRAIRFSTILDFKINDEATKWIKKYNKSVQTLSYARKKEELEKILISKNALKGLTLLNNLGLTKNLDIKFKKVIFVDDLCGMWAQIDVSDKYPFSNKEKENINNIKKILKYGKIDNTVLFEYGLYLCSVAGKILKIDYADINIKYNDLPIKSIKDIEINTKEIMTTLNIKPCNLLKVILEDLKNKILTLELKNEKDIIKLYLVGKWKNAKGDIKSV